MECVCVYVFICSYACENKLRKLIYYPSIYFTHLALTTKSTILAREIVHFLGTFFFVNLHVAHFREVTLTQYTTRQDQLTSWFLWQYMKSNTVFIST